jgi:predicted lipoprotein
MKNLIPNKFLILFAGICVCILSCKSKDDHSSSLVQADRKPLVENLGNNVILPRYAALNTSINDFDTEVQSFVASPSITGLEALRTRFFDAYKKWEYAAQFNFGPASVSTVMLQTETVNVFPSDTTLIRTKIAQGITTIPVTSSTTYSGFPAIDYLLYGKRLTEQQIVDSFTVAAKRCNVLKAVSASLKTKINTTYLNWTASGTNFVNLYTNNTGLDLGSSTSQTINMMVADLENCKNYKLGIPLNIVHNTVIDVNVVNPFKTEAYHSDSSLVLLKASVEAIRLLYMGISAQGIDGKGFDDYLEAIGRTALNVQIKNQIELVQTKLNAIGEPISIAVTTPAGKQKVTEAYNEAQNLLTVLKVDFASAVGVIISYGDTDGD